MNYFLQYIYNHTFIEIYKHFTHFKYVVNLFKVFLSKFEVSQLKFQSYRGFVSFNCFKTLYNVFSETGHYFSCFQYFLSLFVLLRHNQLLQVFSKYPTYYYCFFKVFKLSSSYTFDKYIALQCLPFINIYMGPFAVKLVDEKTRFVK